MAGITAALLLLAGAASAEVPLWDQCGGINHTGETVCEDGAACQSLNPYYFQCVPATTTTASATTVTSTAEPTTTEDTTTTTEEPGSTSSASTSSVPSQTSNPDATYYFINFGDSYSQTGFDYTGDKPSAENPIGNPDLPGWTASGGLNWIGYMTTEFNTSLRLTYNFAYGGATVDADLVEPYTDTVKSMMDQVTDFSAELASHPSYAPWTADNTLVGVWMGVNDVGNSYWLEDEDEILEAILTRYFEQLQIVYDAGARQFVLLSVPPITKTPLMLQQSQEARDMEDEVIALFNSLLATHLVEFESANSDVVATVVDTHPPFNEAINNPTAYGAPDATCYNEDGVSCLWFNDYHPGLAINRLVAAAVAEALEAPYAFC